MDSLAIINKTYQLYKIAADIGSHAERQYRFTVCERAERNVLALLEELIVAKNAPKPLKAGALLRASARQEICVLQFRLMLELDAANETKISQAQARLAEVGRMLGGWLKSSYPS